VLTLKADKISATTAAPTTIVKEGKWAVWYVQGERKVLSSAKDITRLPVRGRNPGRSRVHQRHGHRRYRTARHRPEDADRHVYAFGRIDREGRAQGTGERRHEK
jgi:hypothetical protein